MAAVGSKTLIYKEDLLETLLNHFGVDLAYYGRDLQFCQEAVDLAPTADAISLSLSEVEAYLRERLEEWEALGERKWEPANAWGYNFIRACMDDLENYREKLVDAWML